MSKHIGENKNLRKEFSNVKPLIFLSHISSFKIIYSFQSLYFKILLLA